MNMYLEENNVGISGNPEDLAHHIHTETMSKLTEIMIREELLFHTQVLDLEEKMRDVSERLVLQARSCGVEGFELSKFYKTKFKGTVGSEFNQSYASLAEQFKQTLAKMKASPNVR